MSNYVKTLLEVLCVTVIMDSLLKMGPSVKVSYQFNTYSHMLEIHAIDTDS